MEFRTQRPACGGRRYAADRWPHIASIRPAARSALIASISALAPARSPLRAIPRPRVNRIKAWRPQGRSASTFRRCRSRAPTRSSSNAAALLRLLTAASLIGRQGQALSGHPPLRRQCRSRALASLRTRHQGPSIMGFEDEVEQSFGRPCRQCDCRFKRTYELTSSVVPRGTSFHRLGGFQVFSYLI